MFLFTSALSYFTSPIVHGMQPVTADIPRPAKRVFIFSSDGGRADRFFEVDGEGRPRAPFLVGKAVEKGTWGVSHTRVPTESRPGHVSMLAGIYEDMSAVTKGWQHNPVEFDSVINRRRASPRTIAPQLRLVLRFILSLHLMLAPYLSPSVS